MPEFFITEWRHHKGMTLDDLAEATGYDAGYLSRIANGKRGGGSKVMAAIAAAMDISTGQLYAPPGEAEILDVPARIPTRESMPQDIPVLGSATGGPDGALNIDGPIDHARRPPALLNATGVYCINVSGDSMEPEFRPGMTLYVSENKPAAAGDAVVVQCLVNNGGQDKARLAFVKLMKRKPGGGTRFWQHNEPGEWTPPGKVLAVHRVYPWNELLPTH